MKKKWLRAVFVIAGILLIGGAALLVKHNLEEDSDAEQQALEALSPLQEIIRARQEGREPESSAEASKPADPSAESSASAPEESGTAEAPTAEPTAESGETADPAETRPAPPETETPAEETEPPVVVDLPAEVIDGIAYIGIIEIPSFNISLPIQRNLEMQRMKLSPCRYWGSYLTNDMVLCAHNYSSHFWHLHNLPMGTDVYFITVDGVTYHYIVTNRVFLKESEVSVLLSDGDWDLTLFTCTLDGAQRVTVRCELIDVH